MTKTDLIFGSRHVHTGEVNIQLLHRRIGIREHSEDNLFKLKPIAEAFSKQLEKPPLIQSGCRMIKVKMKRS